MEQIIAVKNPGFLSRSFTLGEILVWIGISLALLVLGAHYYRAGNQAMTICILGILILNCGRSAWKHYVVAAFLFWGAMEWSLSIHSLVAIRTYLEQPWLNAAMILGAVAVLTALAGIYILLNARKGCSAKAIVIVQALAFILVFAALYQIRLYRPHILLLERFWPSWGSIQIVILAWYAAAITGGLLNTKTSRKTRRMAWIIFAFIFFGQLILGLAGVPLMRTLENAHIPIPGLVIFAPLYRGEIGFMPILVLIIVLLAGSAWCSMLCYFGPLEALTSSNKPIRQPTGFLAIALRYGRITILACGLFVSAILSISGLPTGIALAWGLLFAGLSLLVLLIASRKYTGMIHCTAFCPLGLVVNILGRVSPWRIRIDQKLCDNCGTCEKVCAYRAIDSASRQSGNPKLCCSLCRDCIAVCPKKAISLTLPIANSVMATYIFVLLLVILHVLFIATARPL